jgi:hypothetical protein
MKHQRSKQIAQSLIEVTVGIIVMVPVALVLTDLGVILYGVQLNDATCRNAVRAAASGDPNQATPRVQAVIDRANSRTTGIVSNFKLVQPVETVITSQPQAERDPISGDEITSGGPVNGTICATTEVDIKPFAVHGIYGGKSPLKFQSKQSFPISFVRPGS